MSGYEAAVVIPAYQEAANLPALIAGIRRALPEGLVIVIDDASGDGTPEMIRGMEGFGDSLVLLERPGKSGFASALCAGYRLAIFAGARQVAQMDADLSHDPADLPKLLDCLRQGHDLAVGSRYCPGGRVDHWSPWRRRLSRGAGCYVRWWTGLPLHDPTAGFRAFRVQALSEALATPKRCDGYAFQVEMAHAVWKRGGKIAEVPVVFHERREGRSKLSSAIVMEAVLRVPLLGKNRD